MIVELQKLQSLTPSTYQYLSKKRCIVLKKHAFSLWHSCNTTRHEVSCDDASANVISENYCIMLLQICKQQKTLPTRIRLDCTPRHPACFSFLFSSSLFSTRLSAFLTALQILEDREAQQYREENSSQILAPQTQPWNLPQERPQGTCTGERRAREEETGENPNVKKKKREKEKRKP